MFDMVQIVMVHLQTCISSGVFPLCRGQYLSKVIQGRIRRDGVINAQTSYCTLAFTKPNILLHFLLEQEFLLDLCFFTFVYAVVGI